MGGRSGVRIIIIMLFSSSSFFFLLLFYYIFCLFFYFFFYYAVFWYFVLSKSKKYRSPHNFLTSPVTKLYFCNKLWLNPDGIPVRIWYIANLAFFNLHFLKLFIYFSNLIKVKSTSGMTDK